MAGSVKIETRLTIVDDSTSAPLVINTEKTLAFTAFEDKRIVLNPLATAIAWDPTTAGVSAAGNFDFAFILPDGALDLAVTVNTLNANHAHQTQRLAAQIPYLLGSDAAYFSTTLSVVFDAANLSVVDRIRFHEPSSVTRSVRLLLFT